MHGTDEFRNGRNIESIEAPAEPRSARGWGVRTRGRRREIIVQTPRLAKGYPIDRAEAGRWRVLEQEQRCVVAAGWQSAPTRAARAPAAGGSASTSATRVGRAELMAPRALERHRDAARTSGGALVPGRADLLLAWPLLGAFLSHSVLPPVLLSTLHVGPSATCALRFRCPLALTDSAGFGTSRVELFFSAPFGPDLFY